MHVFGCVAMCMDAREHTCVCSGVWPRMRIPESARMCSHVWPCMKMPESTRACVQMCAMHEDTRDEP